MTAKNRMILVVVAGVLAIGAYWFLLLTPRQEEASKLADSISAKQAELETAKQEIRVYEAAKGSYKDNYAAVTRLGKAVPGDDDLRSLMIQLDATARRSGVKFETIDVSKGTFGGPTGAAGAAGAAPATPLPPGVSLNAAGIGEMPLTFAFTGTFFELSDFLRRIERYVTVSGERVDATGRLMTVQTITLKPHSKGFPRILADVSATSYVVPATEDAASAATPAAPGGTGATGTAPSAAPATPPATTATVTGAVR